MDVIILVNLVYTLPWVTLICLIHSVMGQSKLLSTAAFLATISLCGLEARLLHANSRVIKHFFATLPRQPPDFLTIACTVAVFVTIGGVSVFSETIRMYFTL